ncbi:MAG: hypothetical protein AB7G93_04080 [Bdellovibrionales bacterium]
MKKFSLVLSLMLSLSLPAAAESFRYHDLMFKDYEEMEKMVQTLVKKARAVSEAEGESEGEEESPADSEAVEHLREALKLIFSRPDGSDNMVAKLVPEVRRPLSGYAAFEDTVSSLTAEAITTVKNKNASVVAQSTSLVMLKNILAEIQPEIGRNEDLRKVVQNVKDAKIKVPSEVRNDRTLRGFETFNPSDYASKMLKKLEEDKKKEEKEKQKAKK